MSKLKYIMMIALITGLGLNSCSKDDDMNGSYNSDPEAVNIKVSVGNAVKSNPTGDDASRKLFFSDDQVTISTDDDQSATYKYDGSDWTPSDNTKYIKWDNERITFGAFYPANTVDNNASLTTFTLPSDQSITAKIASADYMTATNEIKGKSAGSVELSLKRKTAIINVVISEFGDQYTAAQDYVSDVKIYSAKGDLTTDPAESKEITPYTTTVGDGRLNTVYTAIVIPSDAASDKTFISLTDGTEKTLTVPGIKEALAGKSYTYNLKVGKTLVSVNSVTVNDWGTGAIISGGDAEDAENIPFLDATFEAAVIAKMKKVNSALTMSFIDITNSDQLAALASITILNVQNESITSLRGIEYLTGLTELYCSNNSLSALDVSKNTALTNLQCNGNSLSVLDVSKNTALTELHCDGNSLSALDVSKNTALTVLYCYDNSLSVLDVSNNTALADLECNDNRLSVLYVSNNTALTKLNCSNNRLSVLDFSNAKLPNGYYLYCGSQTSDGTTTQNITLTLTAAQKTYWDSDLVSKDQNSRVTVVSAE